MSNEMMIQEVNTMMIIDGLKLDRVQNSMEKIQQFQKMGSLLIQLDVY